MFFVFKALVVFVWLNVAMFAGVLLDVLSYVIVCLHLVYHKTREVS